MKFSERTYAFSQCYKLSKRVATRCLCLQTLVGLSDMHQTYHVLKVWKFLSLEQKVLLRLVFVLLMLLGNFGWPRIRTIEILEFREPVYVWDGNHQFVHQIEIVLALFGYPFLALLNWIQGHVQTRLLPRENVQWKLLQKYCRLVLQGLVHLIARLDQVEAALCTFHTHLGLRNIILIRKEVWWRIYWPASLSLVDSNSFSFGLKQLFNLIV